MGSYVFNVRDLDQLIKQTRKDLKEIDEKRKEEFKKHELEKEYQRKKQLEVVLISVFFFFFNYNYS